MQTLENTSLKKYATLGIGGTVAKEYILEEVGDIEKVALEVQKDSLPHFIMGGGSNMLLDDRRHDKILIRDRINAKNEVEIVKEDAHSLYLTLPSGMYLPVFLNFCEKNALSGLEGLTGIPGRMGGALAMNAGAFSCEIQAVFESATIFTPEQGLKVYSKNDVNFAYRHFSLRHEYSYLIIADLTVKMKKSSHELVKQCLKDNFTKKKSSQPLNEKTAGCVFKNPIGNSAGKLIDEVGLKGFRKNSAGFSSIHANFLVNYKDATFEDALELIELAKERVYAQFGIRLETEIKIIHSN